MSEKVVGFEMYQTIVIGIPNFNFGGLSPGEARALVEAGEARYLLAPGGVLTIVPPDYEPGSFEDFLRYDPEVKRFVVEPK